jgi:CHAT domain-containing protein/tetratricopeptide (TPR) repeat protein
LRRERTFASGLVRRAADLLAIGALTLIWHSPEPRPVTSIERLVRAAAALPRSIDVRLTGGFRWTPARTVRRLRNRPTNDELELEGIAGEILRAGERPSSVESLHAAGIAALLIDQRGDAIVQLERALRLAPHDGAIASDLAAARFAAAMDRNEPERLPGALAAADRALRSAPDLAEARFNRALILDRLGLRNGAERAWRELLAVEHDDAWRSEAHRHLRELAVRRLPPLTAELDDCLARANSGDGNPLIALIRGRAQEVRTSGETQMVTEWAEATTGGEDERATQMLKRLRLVGAALAATTGDRLLGDAVHAIDRSGPAARVALARAHIVYRDARLHYRRQLAGSDEELRHASVLFADAGSPMAQVARYYSANAMFDRNRVDGAREMLERVLRDVDPVRYPSLAAGAEKELGLYYAYRGMWSAALLHLDRSCKLFTSVGEAVNAAFAEAIIGEVCDRTGRFDLGWRHRVAALPVLNRVAPDQRSLAIVIGAVHAEIMRGDFESALSLLAVARREASAVGDSVLSAETMIRQARVLSVSRGRNAAVDALEDAKRAAARIADPLTRRRIEADIGVVEAALVPLRNAAKAVEIVTPSIDFYETNGFGMLLPPAYLERGRAHLASGDAGAALADFRKGLAEIERQRADVALDVRSAILDTVPELIAETLDLLLASGRDAEAYAVVERARARTLIESLGVRKAVSDVSGPAGTTGSAADRGRIARIAESLPADGVLIEYALLPRGIAVFCITHDGMTVERLPADNMALRRRIDELDVAIATREPIDSVRRLGASLYADLVAPLDHRIGAAKTLYVVPDRFLYATPFPALYDSRHARYLIESHRVVIAPSGEFLLRRTHLSRRFEPALIVSDPVSDPMSSGLPAARREAAAVAQLYRSVTLLAGHDATRERFLAAAPRSALIHYAGHADSDDDAGGFLPLAIASGRDGRLDATAITRLSLTRTNLVILSACATMRGSATRVEGMPSIARGFLTAGSPAVLGMLWEVEDESAARLLLLFHRRLRLNDTPSAALQAAQRALLQSETPELRHPASWAAAELLGVD